MTTDMEKWKKDWNRLTRQNAFGAVLSMTKEYSEDEFRDSGKKVWTENIAPFLPPDCGVIVDLGCGAGRVMEFARQHCDRVIGVDISEEMLRIAEDRLGTDGYEYTDSLDGVETSSVDLIYTVGVFKHLTSEMIEGYVRQASRVLRPGGVFYMHYYGAPPRDFDKWVDESSDDKDAQHPRTNRVTPKERMIALLHDNSFDVAVSGDYRIVAERRR